MKHISNKQKLVTNLHPLKSSYIYFKQIMHTHTKIVKYTQTLRLFTQDLIVHKITVKSYNVL